MRIAVISDIHSVAHTFRRALDAARDEGFDQLILLGDLFTYGVDPRECAELALEAIELDDALLVAGNHDQLYLDLDHRRSAYFEKLPDWIKESATWTWRELGSSWPRGLEPIPEWAWDGLLFAHANPFGFGDWTYLSTPELMSHAAAVLRQRGFRAGIFGHLHREAEYRDELGTLVHIVNSTGQPRKRGAKGTSWTRVDVNADRIDIETRQVVLDASTLRKRIWEIPDLSANTKSRLCGFYQ